jgi:glutathione reductase (NADPH)
MEKHYDLIAIGGGSGGLSVAQRAARLGARAAIVEPGRLGGTCVNLGCVPKKVMWCAASLARSIGDAADYGFDVELRGLDWARLKSQRDAYVARLNDAYAQNLARRGVDHIAAPARFEKPDQLRAGDLILRAPHVVIATGGRPWAPAIPGAEHGIDSDGFFALDRCPQRVAVVGGGYIAVELAGILHALGAQVCMIVRGDALLRGFDDMLGARLAEEMSGEGIEILLRTELGAVQRGRALRLTTTDGRELEGYDCLLWATGRAANTGTLAVTRAGVALTASGRVAVDDLQRTNVRGIYAIGDVTDGPALTPVAIAAGRRLAERLFAGPPDRRLDYEHVPTVIFSNPPVGTVGLTEAQARARHGDDVKVYQRRFTPLYHQLTRRKPQVNIKLVTAGAEERVVGVHLVGLNADEILQGFTVAVRMGATKAQLDDTVAIHPTVAEELVTMRA